MKIVLPYDSASRYVPTRIESRVSKNMLYHVYGNDPSAHQGMMGKQNVIYIQGMLFILKVEGNADICYNMDKPWGLYAKWDNHKSWILYVR